MTGVYSGGLVYEYSQEESNYGLVNIKNGAVSERPDFAALKEAYAATPPPQGDGGYQSDNPKSTCPTTSKTWLLDDDALPAIPEKAKQYMTDGAGDGKGFKGAGSQTAGEPSSGTAESGSGQPSTSALAGSAESSSAATPLRLPELSVAPLVVTLVVALSSLIGASLL